MEMIQEIWRYKYTVGASCTPPPRFKVIHMPIGKRIGEHPF